MNANFKLVMKFLIAHFFSTKALRRQKRYLQRGYISPATKIFKTSSARLMR